MTLTRSTWLAAGILVVLVCALFGRTVGYDFVYYDDDSLVAQNPLIRGLGPAAVWRMFSSCWISSYYPVRLLSLALDYALWGPKPGGYHLTNVLLHALNVVLLFLLLLRLGGAGKSASRTGDASTIVHAGGDRDGVSRDRVGAVRDRTREAVPPAGGGARLAAFLAACLFAWHPVVVEPVAWVAGREELLTALFALSALHSHLGGWRARLAGRRGQAVLFRALTAVACGLGCLSNVVGAAVPLLLVAFNACYARGAGDEDDLPAVLRTALQAGDEDAHDLASLSSWRRLCFGVSVPLLLGIVAILLKVFPPFPPAPVWVPPNVPAVPGLRRACLVALTYGLNIRTLLWPTGLIVPYPLPIPASGLRVGVVAGAGLILVTLWSVWRLRRFGVVCFGLAWWLAGLLASSQAFPHHLFRADRFLYLPLTGLALAVGAVLLKVPASRARRVLMSLVWLALGLLLVRSAGQVSVWRDGESLFSHAIRVRPESIRARCCLGEALTRRGDMLGACAQFEQAWQRGGRDALLRRRLRDAHFALGNRCRAQRSWQAAAAHYARALTADPVHVPSHVNMGVSLAEQGQIEQAIQAFSQAVRLGPTNGMALSNLGAALALRGDAQEAIRCYEAALEHGPDDPGIREELARLRSQGR